MVRVAEKLSFGAYLFSFLTATKLISVFPTQENFPLRFQGFHFINEPFYLYTVYSIIKPFLKEKIRRRVRCLSFRVLLCDSGAKLFTVFILPLQVYFHGNHFGSLHKHVSPNVLPKCFGGTLEYDPITWVQQFLNKERYFQGKRIYISITGNLAGFFDRRRFKRSRFTAQRSTIYIYIHNNYVGNWR